jgi:hypothetical protein
MGDKRDNSFNQMLLFLVWFQLSIEAHELEPVMPQPNDKVKVIVGEHKECTGVLLSVDNGEGVVKLTEEDDVKMIDVKFLCKYKPE